MKKLQRFISKFLRKTGTVLDHVRLQVQACDPYGSPLRPEIIIHRKGQIRLSTAKINDPGLPPYQALAASSSINSRNRLISGGFCHTLRGRWPCPSSGHQVPQGTEPGFPLPGYTVSSGYGKTASPRSLKSRVRTTGGPAYPGRKRKCHVCHSRPFSSPSR